MTDWQSSGIPDWGTGCTGVRVLPTHVAWASNQYRQIYKKKPAVSQRLLVGFIFFSLQLGVAERDTSLGSPHAENSSHSTNRTQAPQTWRLSLSKEHYGRIKQTLLNGFHGMQSVISGLKEKNKRAKKKLWPNKAASRSHNWKPGKIKPEHSDANMKSFKFKWRK